MIVIPAIDLRGGRCVRLIQGDYNRETVFDDDPVAVGLRWQTAGATRLHVVDLDGARDGVPRQRETIAAIVNALNIPVQVGGGIRSREHADELFSIGVERVVLGTAAVNHPQLVADLIASAGAARVIVGVDARNGQVATQGWLETSSVAALDLIGRMGASGVRRVVYTDIERDGMLMSPNFDAVAEAASLGVSIIASGGVSRREDLIRLALIPNVEAAIVGRAIYTGDVVLAGADWSIDRNSAASEIGAR
ncbi:MAG TPA: 1-(5-phosphoribosyl)-5-[(5-phosphoribosylamino)methylideneamino]imidazole-4-carboxamide isomerase [Thermomicrobiales bacterium]|nr:1-(5-phosphoribosyl)-5-[(5-phosphoribosylamino)methylideneamino]imidazole-4-carboxamide isomerase [Thermomicrobiales bacterium]